MTTYNAPHPGQNYPQEHPQGTLILTFGILGIFFQPLAIAAWVMGSKALNEINASGTQCSNRSNVNAGKILGMIVTILTIIAIVLTTIIFIALLVAATGDAGY